MRLEHHKKPRRSRSKLLYFETISEAVLWGRTSLLSTLERQIYGDVEVNYRTREYTLSKFKVCFEQDIGRGGEYVRGFLRDRLTNKRIGIQTRNLYYGD